MTAIIAAPPKLPAARTPLDLLSGEMLYRIEQHGAAVREDTLTPADDERGAKRAGLAVDYSVHKLSEAILYGQRRKDPLTPNDRQKRLLLVEAAHQAFQENADMLSNDPDAIKTRADADAAWDAIIAAAREGK